LDNLDETARLVTGKPLEKIKLTPVEVQRIVGKTRILKNRNVTELTRKYIEDFPRDTKINVPEVVTWLKSQGVTGKDKSLNAAVHVILKKEASKENTELHYTKGLGFYKGKPPEDTLVASV
jgi:hypothetical protein